MIVIDHVRSNYSTSTCWNFSRRPRKANTAHQSRNLNGSRLQRIGVVSHILAFPVGRKTKLLCRVVPYWNYAARPLMPEIAVMAKITVTTPEGSLRTFDRNPMTSYQVRDSSGKVATFGSLPPALQLGDSDVSFLGDPPIQYRR